MDAKSYLMQISRINAMIDNKKIELDRLKNSIGYSSPSFGEKVQGSLDPNKQVNMLLKACELEKEITMEMNNLIDVKIKVMRTIDSLTDPRDIDVLYKRYLHQLTWEEIAVAMGYEVRQVYRIHGHALAELNARMSLNVT